MPSTDIKAKLDEVAEQIADLEPKVKDRWLAFEQKRDEFASSGAEANRTDSAEFEAAEEIHRSYAEKAQELRDLQAFQSKLFTMAATDQPSGPREPEFAVTKAEAIPGRRRTFGERATESEGYKHLVDSGALKSENRGFNAEIGSIERDELKALITGLSDTSGGAFVLADQWPYQAQPRRSPRIFDLITVGDTDSDAVSYVRQTTFTNVAAETLEATSVATGSKPEATMAFERVTEAVSTIAHWIPATRQALADAAQLRTLIDSQLRYGLEFRLETQLISGDGTSPNLSGILDQSNTLSQAKGSLSVADAIHKGITQLRLGYIEPTGAAMHPTDWEVLRLSRDDGGATTGTGGYLWGPPSQVGPQTVWGLPVVVTPAVPDDTAIVADWRYGVLWIREAAQILASDSHDDFFVKNLVAILAEMRAAFGLLLPQAFCKVTSVD